MKSEQLIVNKKKILFIVNNLSGTVSQYNVPKCIDMFLDRKKFEPKIFYIGPEYESNNYKPQIEKGWDIIVSVGGDGTLLKLGRRVMDKNLIIGMIPIGSGNGLATHIGYKPRDIEAAFQAINRLKTRKIDVAKINKKYFFSNFGLGIDAIVARDFKVKKKRSFFVYTYLTLRRLIKIESNTIRYKTDTEEKTVETYLFNIFNSNLYGYNVGLLPWANAFDGKLDVVYLKKIPFWKMPWAAICILIKKPELCRDLIFFETEKITILNSKQIVFQVDGDPKKTTKNIEIEVLPSKLEMIVP